MSHHINHIDDPIDRALHPIPRTANLECLPRVLRLDYTAEGSPILATRGCMDHTNILSWRFEDDICRFCLEVNICGDGATSLDF